MNDPVITALQTLSRINSTYNICKALQEKDLNALFRETIFCLSTEAVFAAYEKRISLLEMQRQNVQRQYEIQRQMYVAITCAPAYRDSFFIEAFSY